MIGYVTLGTNDLDKAARFYDALMAELGATRLMEMEGFITWAVNQQIPALSLTAPHNGQPATVGNGVMVALAADSPDKVDAVYRKAIELGGKCEGPSGKRGESFYAGYFRDLEGNKLNVFCIMQAA